MQAIIQIPKKKGIITFFSEAPIENISAVNNNVSAVYDSDTQEIVFQLKIKDFIFIKKLMQEHFNENYVESEKYPKATFKGTFTNLPADLSKQHELLVAGVMDFHGVQKDIEVNVSLQLMEGELVGTSNFVLLCSDFGIKIPKIVSDKLANEIQVTVKAALTKI